MCVSALIAASSLAVVGPATATASSAAPVCATRGEFREIHNGMRMRRVKRIIGGSPFEAYNTKHNSTYAFWHHCADNGDVFVHFQDNSGSSTPQPRLVVYKNWNAA